MVEIYNLAGTQSLGRFNHFKAARPTLDDLRKAGKLGKEIPAVRMSSFVGKTLVRVCVVAYCDKWRFTEEWSAVRIGSTCKTKPVKQAPSRKPVRRRKKCSSEIAAVFADAQAMFRHFK